MVLSVRIILNFIPFNLKAYRLVRKTLVSWSAKVSLEYLISHLHLLCLVKKKYAAPFMGQLKVVVQTFLHFRGRFSDISTSYWEQGSLGQVCDALRR
jgi:hypothetical protein